MKSKTIIMINLLTILLFQPVMAATLTFDELSIGQVLTNTCYQGICFGSDFLWATKADYFGSNMAVSSGPNSFWMGSFIARFPVLAGYVEIGAGDEGGDKDSFTIEIYDSADRLLGSASSGQFGGNKYEYGKFFADYATLGIDGQNIAYAKFIPTSASGYGIFWDDLTYTPQSAVSEPLSLVMLGIGLIGIAGVGRMPRICRTARM